MNKLRNWRERKLYDTKTIFFYRHPDHVPLTRCQVKQKLKARQEIIGFDTEIRMPHKLLMFLEIR